MRSPSPRTSGRKAPGDRRCGPRLACLVAATLGAGCVCPAPAALADAGFRTPKQTLRSYQAYMASDLVDWEYRCYSSGFRRRNGISLATYAEARAQLLAERPWLKYFAKAEIVREWQNVDDSHGIEARVAGRTVHVRLVREDSFEILAGDELLTDGYAPFGQLVRVLDSPSGPALEARVSTDRPGLDLRRATALRVEQSWKIDELAEPDPSRRPRDGPPSVPTP